jgi:hypothetical protein
MIYLHKVHIRIEYDSTGYINVFPCLGIADHKAPQQDDSTRPQGGEGEGGGKKRTSSSPSSFIRTDVDNFILNKLSLTICKVATPTNPNSCLSATRLSLQSKIIPHRALMIKGDDISNVGYVVGYTISTDILRKNKRKLIKLFSTGAGDVLAKGLEKGVKWLKTKRSNVARRVRQKVMN